MQFVLKIIDRIMCKRGVPTQVSKRHAAEYMLEETESSAPVARNHSKPADASETETARDEEEVTESDKSVPEPRSESEPRRD